MIDNDGWLRDIPHCPSPNCDDRPNSMVPEVIIIHAISLPPRQYGGQGIQQLFTNSLSSEEHPYYAKICDMQVSAHFLVRRTGEVIQFVSCHQRAWHAGHSECLGRDRVNDFSIGIELEGCDQESFTRIQYQALATLVKDIHSTFPMTRQNPLYGHSDIAPGRKTDPGPCFQWDRFQYLLE